MKVISYNNVMKKKQKTEPNHLCRKIADGDEHLRLYQGAGRLFSASFFILAGSRILPKQGERLPQAQHYPKVMWLASFFILKSKFIIEKGDFSGAVGELESLIFKGWLCFLKVGGSVFVRR